MYTLFLGRGKTIIFKNEKEFLEFLKTDESLFLWREHHDLVIFADLLNIPIDVIITKENVVTGHVQITPSERNKSDIVKIYYRNLSILPTFSTQHQQAKY